MSFIPFPAGVLLPFGGTTAPAGWLLCDGAAVSRTTYAALFAAIGTTYGVGDGATTFNVPNPAGRVLCAASGSHALGSITGAETHTLAVTEMPAHGHTVTDPGHSHNILAGTSGTGGIDSTAQNGTNLAASAPGTQGPANATGITIQNNGSGGAHNNMQPTIFFTAIIKT
jgi:microcystin-dependent protein